MRLFTKLTFAAGLLAHLAMAQLPPLIDRELLFGNPEIAGAQLSPNGEYIAFLKPWKDTRNVWVKKANEPFASARLLTSETKRPVPFFLWTRDSKYVLFIKDNDGDENFNLFAVDPAAETPTPRDLTSLKGVRVQFYSLPKNDPQVAYIGLNDRDKSWHDLYKLNIGTGERTLVRTNSEKIASWIFDLNGRLRLAARTADNGDQETLRVDASGFTQVYSCNVFEACDALRFHKDGVRVYLQTNKGDSVDKVALALFDPATGKIETVESDPLKRADLEDAVFSEATDELVATGYMDDRMRRYFRDKAYERDFRWLEKQNPGTEVSVVSKTADERYWLINPHSDIEPGQVLLFDRKTRKLTFQYKVREKLPREALSPMRTIHYKSSDGLDIPAYLTLPKGMPGRGLPVVVMPHGGPWGRDVWGYNGLAQFLANRGYGVLMPNFRASTGFGKQFLNAGNGEWGRKMQDDITWGAKYLIAQGIADPKRIGILGGSYGGYATLAGVAFTPDVYRAAVDIVGPSNLLTLLEAIPPYWEAGRKIMYGRMADPGTPEGKAWMRERSPLYSAAKIKTPLMVVQGANDPRVNRGEAEQIVIALRDRGFPVEYLLAPDEGHGFQRPVNNLALFMAVEKFLAQQLDGRYQEGGSPESVARLKEITVDPKTVVLSKKVDAASVSVPKTAGTLQAGVYRYQAKLAMGAQEMALKLSTEIKEGDGGWTAIDTMETPMGAAVDTAVLDKNSLVLKTRNLKQGPMSANFDFAGGKAAGAIQMGGKETPVSVELGGPLFADGPGAPQAIGVLPLAAGYSTTFRNFDPQTQKMKLIRLTVAGTESVTVPAGTFDAFKVELNSADGGSDKMTLWIEKDSHRAVKLSAVLGQMGGATLLAELLP